MAGKLSELRVSAPAGAITGSELIEVTQGGVTKAATAAELLGAQTIDGLADVDTAGAAVGSIIYRASAGWVQLSPGASGHVLTSAGTGQAPAWSAPAAPGTGTVTSVGLSAPTIFDVTGSPITGAGSITLALASQAAGLVLASPAASTGTPAFRALAATDLPSHSHPEAQRIGINTQTGTTYTAAASDAGKIVRCNNAAAVSVTLPTGGLFVAGDVVMVRQVGAGQVTVSGGTLNIPTGAQAKTRAQGSVMSLHYVAADTWDVSGDLA